MMTIGCLRLARQPGQRHAHAATVVRAERACGRSPYRGMDREPEAVLGFGGRA